MPDALRNLIQFGVACSDARKKCKQTIEEDEANFFKFSFILLKLIYLVDTASLIILCGAFSFR